MNTKLSIETRVRRLPYYLEDIQKGLLQIPPFQRDLVWGNKERLDLFDSLKNGYPIGSILLWKPQEQNLFEARNKVGAYNIKSRENDGFFYVLDGFQRLATLFSCLTDPQKTELNYDKEELRRNFNICYDLDEERFMIPRTDKIEIYQVPVYRLIDTRFAYIIERELRKGQYSDEKIDAYLDRYTQLGSTLIDYSLPAIEITGGAISEAVEIFSRVNSKGATISPDWMVSALSYNKEQNFRLGTAIDELLNDLKMYNFHEIKREVILQCITNSFGSFFIDQSKKIEDLARRADFITTALETVKSIKKAVQFLYEELLVVYSKLLPYNIQLIFVTAFFNELPNPTAKQIEALKKWFWITSYANYFTMYSPSKQRLAYKQFQEFLQDKTENPVYNDKPEIPFVVTELPDKIYFGSVRAKSYMLFLLNYANDFQKINAEDIDDLKLFYLFNESQDAESLMPMLEYIDPQKNYFRTLTNTPKPKDLAAFLTYNGNSFSNYFLDEEMQMLYSKNPDDKETCSSILEKRKQIIYNAEKSFIEEMGMKVYVPKQQSPSPSTQ